MTHWHIVVEDDDNRRRGALCTTLDAANRELAIERRKHKATVKACTDACFACSPLRIRPEGGT